MLAGVLVYGSGVIVPGLSWRSVVCAFEFVFCGVALECVFGFGGRLCFGLWIWFRLPAIGLLGLVQYRFLVLRVTELGLGFVVGWGFAVCLGFSFCMGGYNIRFAVYRP